MLEIINERFSEHLRTALLRHLRPGIEVAPPIVIQLLRHDELIEKLATPSHMTLVGLKPLRGTILVVVDAHLVSWIVESRFGGDGRFPITAGDRELSPFEQKSASRVVQTVVEQLALAWQPIASFEAHIARHETNPQFAAIANPGEQVIVNVFDVRVGQGGGKLTVCIPYVMLEPLHERLVGDLDKVTVNRDPRWQEALTLGIGQATMVLRVELAKLQLTAGDLLALRAGSIFDIAQPESVTVEANGVPLFRGRWGKYGRKIGVRIEERLQAEADALAPARPERNEGGGEDEQ